jgi:ubiquinone/menaquinone biosynthesis C-methylase UbiE
MNCNPIARFYRFFEYLRFGRALERCRFAMLPHIQIPENVLLIGDGDGRFLRELAKKQAALHIDYIDVSAVMLQLAQRHLRYAHIDPLHQIYYHQADVRTATLPRKDYDLVCCHFLFDVFSARELQPLIRRVAAHTTNDAQWIVSEFDLPSRRWSRLIAKFWIELMYRFFRITTGLTNQTLPRWRPLLTEAGFAPHKRAVWKKGFIVSELWQRRATD